MVHRLDFDLGRRRLAAAADGGASADYTACLGPYSTAHRVRTKPGTCWSLFHRYAAIDCACIWCRKQSIGCAVNSFRENQIEGSIGVGLYKLWRHFHNRRLLIYAISLIAAPVGTWLHWPILTAVRRECCGREARCGWRNIKDTGERLLSAHRQVRLYTSDSWCQYKQTHGCEVYSRGFSIGPIESLSS